MVISDSNVAIAAVIDSTTVSVNGISMNMDRPAVFKNDTVYMPVRALADTFGYRVSWDGDTFTVLLTKSAETIGPTFTSTQNKGEVSVQVQT